MMASSIVDDQEILKLKKISGKKRRSRNSFSSSASLLNENLEVNRSLDGESTMVYALVEVSRESGKPARREKIPLNSRDLYFMMQKFVNSKKEKSDRRILRPSLKRKYGLECVDSNTKIMKPQKISELRSQNLDFIDKTNISYQYSYHSSIEKIKNGERYGAYRKMHSGDDEFRLPDQVMENSDLKVLYNRNMEAPERKNKFNENISMSRGTNTDIVQTPKVLEEVLQSLNTNFDFTYSGMISELGSEESSSERRKNFTDTYEPDDKREKKFNSIIGPKPVQNLLLVPFIITSKHVGMCKKTNSCESINDDGQRCSNHFQSYGYKCHQQDTLCCIKNYKSSTDIRPSLHPVNIQMNSLHGLKVDYPLKNEFVYGNEKSVERCEIDGNKDQITTDGKLFLEEVKVMQMKLNTIIKGLEMNNAATSCSAKIEINTTSESLRPAEECRNSSESVAVLSNQSDKITTLQDSGKPTQEELCLSQDFSVQVTMTKSLSDKTVAVPFDEPLDPIQEKTVMLDKLSQFPSEMKVDIPREKRRLVSSKSDPYCQINGEHRFIKMKKTASLFSVDKIETTDFLSFRNMLNLELEGSRSDGGQFEDKESEPFTEEQNTKCELNKTADVISKKSSTTGKEEKDGLHLFKPGGKVAKIKIIGSTTLGKEGEETGTGDITFSLDETSSIKITNKFTKKIKTNINGNSNKNMNIKNVGMENPSKSNEIKMPNFKSEGNKTSRKEPNQKPTKPGGMLTKATDGELNIKASKLRKPAVPVRTIPKGKNPEQDSPNKSSHSPAKQSKSHSNEVQKVIKVEKTTEKLGEAPIQENNIPPLVNEVRNIPSSDSAKTVIHNPIKDSEKESPLDSDSIKQSQAVKSIWALTKVILYKDGSQSFEVLEASSSPPGYHLNKNKENGSCIEIPDNDPSNSSAQVKINYSDNNDVNNSNSKEKTR